MRKMPLTKPILNVLVLTLVGVSLSSNYAQTPVTPNDEVDRQRPQSAPLKYELPPIDPKQVSPPSPLLPRELVSVPDRWRIVESLGVKFPWYDPYNQNVYKGDKPYEPFAKWGSDWFLALSAISDSLIEARRLPTPVVRNLQPVLMPMMCLAAHAKLGWCKP
jgi:hypothetical protein